MDPAIEPGKKGTNSRAIIDACWPYNWRENAPRTCVAEKTITEEVLTRWGDALLGHT